MSSYEEEKLTGEARKKKILLTIEDLFVDWLYYDRKEDYELPLGSIKEAIEQNRRGYTINPDERVTELSDLIARVMGDSVEEQIADYESQLAQVREDHKGRKKPALYESIVGVYLGILEGLKKDLRQRKERGA